MSQKPVKVSFDWNGGVYEPTSVVSSIDKGLSFIRPKDSTNTVIRFLVEMYVARRIFQESHDQMPLMNPLYDGLLPPCRMSPAGVR